jgi:transposase
MEPLTVAKYFEFKKSGYSDRQIQDLTCLSEHSVRQFKKQRGLTRGRKPVASKYQPAFDLLGDGQEGSKYAELRRQGFGDLQIYQALKIPKHAFLKWKARLNLIERRPRRLHMLTVAEYQNFIRNGLDEPAIAAMFGVGARALRKWRLRNNVPAPRLKRYPPTPKQLPGECLEMMKRLYPLLEKIQISDIRSTATEVLERSVWRFYCKAKDGQALNNEEQIRYINKVINRCIVDFRKHKQTLNDMPWMQDKLCQG